MKIRDSILNPLHPRGRHKARVFSSALRFNQSDAEVLRHELLRAAIIGEALEAEGDSWGRRYVLDFESTRNARRVMIRSIWIVPAGSEIPGLITCFVL